METDDKVKAILANQELSFDEKMCQISEYQNQKIFDENIKEIKQRCFYAAIIGANCAEITNDEELYSMINKGFDQYCQELEKDGLYLAVFEMSGICIRWNKPIDYPEVSELPAEN